MDVRDIEHWLKKRPFEPFVMRLTTGDNIRVNHPDAVVPGSKAVLVIYKKRGRLTGFSHFSLFHVVKIEPINGAARPRRTTTRKAD